MRSLTVLTEQRGQVYFGGLMWQIVQRDDSSGSLIAV